jgi:hypothetical protein
VERYAAVGLPHVRTNATAQGPVLEDVAKPDAGESASNTTRSCAIHQPLSLTLL